MEYCSAEEVSHLENGGLIEQTGESGSSVQDHDDKGLEKPGKENENDGQNPQNTRLTSKQLNYLKRLARDRRMTDKELRAKTMEDYKKQPEYLTKKEASELIDELLTQETV